MSSRWFWIFCLFHLLAWTIAPSLFRPNAPFDTVEGIVWGNQWQWGYYKHPPLAAWLSALFTNIGGTVGWPTYLLGQISVIICFWAIWQLARKILPPIYALPSVIILEGITFYNIASEQFNPNSLMIPLWALSSYSFYQALTKQSTRNWLLVGLFAGLSILAKYESALLLLSMLLMLIFSNEGRKSFKKSGLYLGVFLFLLVIAPNIVWLYNHDFLPFKYAAGRLNSQHYIYPVKFLIGQLGIIAPFLFLFLFVYQKEKENFTLSTFNKRFLILIGLGPVLFTMSISAFRGMWINNLWAFPFYSFLGILFFAWFKPKLNLYLVNRFKVIVSVHVCLFLVGRCSYHEWGPYWQHQTKSTHYPGRNIAYELTEEWRRTYQLPLCYVAGDDEVIKHISAYSPDHPSPYFDWNPLHASWIDEQELLQKGALFVWYGDIPQDILRRFPQAVVQPVRRFPRMTEAEFSPYSIGIAYLPPNKID